MPPTRNFDAHDPPTRQRLRLNKAPIQPLQFDDAHIDVCYQIYSLACYVARGFVVDSSRGRLPASCALDVGLGHRRALARAGQCTLKVLYR
ncbi:hypothetical protein DFH09DRAFT_1282718 [Mycena vulgaris]|nr:hypothetical protein DFH09DRAFT_1282718 [Mycena vulgaris]